MKKIFKLSAIALCLGLFFAITSCNSGVNNAQAESNEPTEFGSASFNIVIPDYYAMAQHARAIAPQTTKVRLSYLKNSSWVIHNTIDLSTAEKTPVPNAPEGFSGSVYRCSFSSVPSGEYSSGSLKIDLLDNSDNIISSGTNNATVRVVMDETTQATFYTIPTNADAASGSLAAGEMKFLRKEFDSQVNTELTITVPSGSDYPDIVIFNENGSYERYIAVLSNTAIDFSEYKGYTKYIGFWSQTATSYNAAFTELTQQDESTDLSTAFDDILTSSDWTITNSSALAESNGIYAFDGKKQTGSIKRNIVLSEDYFFSFKIFTNLYEQYDGVLQFLIDNEVKARYTGLNSGWQNVVFEIPEGEHTIEWKRYDTSSSYSTGSTLLAAIADFNFTSANSPTDLDTAFDDILTGSDWTITNSAAISESNGEYSFNGQAQTGGIKRFIILSEAKNITFKVRTNLYQQYDGVLQFLIDNEVKASYTGLNGGWQNECYEIGPGKHTIEWKRNDSSSSYTSGQTLFATIKDFTFTDATPEETETDVATVFNGILERFDWTVTNAGAITETNGVYTFDGQKQTGGFKRRIIISEAKSITFKVKTNLYETYDGSLQFLIDNEVAGTYTGLGGIWQNAVFEITAGEHTIEWKRYDTSSSYSTGSTLFASIKDLAFGEPIQALEEINQTFESGISDINMWQGAGVYAQTLERDPIYASWAQYGDALVDTHGKVFKLGTYENNVLNDSSLTIYKITVSEESALSFEYKCDLYTATPPTNFFRVYIDNAESASFEASGYGQMWQNGSVILPAGTHSVKFTTSIINYSPSLTNSVYIDNITLTPNTIDSVDIYPKGLQETYVGGDTIKFSAKALRSDGTVINGKTVTWSATGGTIDTNGVFTPGSSSGTVTVTATIDGITASNSTVVIHGTNYLSDSVTINGHEFTGTISNGSGSRSNTTNITWESPTPEYSSFTTDGFFILKGTANNTYGFVKVTKGSYETTYILASGDFEQRIWLRFGDGEYTVFVTEMPGISYYANYDGYEGDLSNYGSYYTTGPTTTSFTVTNSSNLNYTAEECAHLMPSYICQSDNFLISNAVHAVISELPENATIGQKLQALHDWEIHRSHYDLISFNHDSKRKKQDAVHVLKYEMGVCEGYANLYAALARHLGVQTAYQSSVAMNHGWVECRYNGEWKLVDATWDDPTTSSSDSNVEKNPTAENYKYFLISRSGVNNDHYNNTTSYERSALIDSDSRMPKVRGMPDGWY